MTPSAVVCLFLFAVGLLAGIQAGHPVVGAWGGVGLIVLFLGLFGGDPK